MAFPVNTERRYTYRDYLTWPDGERWELIDGVPYAMFPEPEPAGVPYAMSPAPAFAHQAIVFELAAQIRNLLVDKPYRGMVSPIDVRLRESSNSDDAETIVQPDLLVVCDPKKIDARGIKGAPDFIIEVLSPSSACHDQITKAGLYEKHGVREYWVVDPIDKLTTVRVLNSNGAYDVQFVEAKGMIAVSIFESFALDLDLVFAAIPPE